jgi:uncharacterized protein YndB with AHSA1/START domain
VGDDAIRIRRSLPGPIDRLWAHLVDSDRRATWLCAGATELKVGGRVDLHIDHARLSPEPDDPPPPKYTDMPPQVSFSGEVTACEPPHRLAYTWAGEGEDSHVEYVLTEEGDQVDLTITHTRIPSRDHRVGASAGWHVHLDILDDVLAGRRPEPFWRRYVPVEAAYERQDLT